MSHDTLTKIMRYLLCFLLFSTVLAATKVETVKIYLVVSSRSGDRTIEKIYLFKENAEKYCNMYKDSHNYVIEEANLKE